MIRHVLDADKNPIFLLEMIEKDVLVVRFQQYKPGHLKALAFEMLDLLLSTSPSGLECYIISDLNALEGQGLTLAKEDRGELISLYRIINAHYPIRADIHIAERYNALPIPPSPHVISSLPIQLYRTHSMLCALELIKELRSVG